MVYRRRTILVLLAVILVLSGCKITLPWVKKIDMTRATPDGLYQQGVQYYQDGSYKKAGEVFQRLKEEYPLSKYAIMAEMGIGDSFFSSKDYIEAELVYSEFINLHPTNENLPYVMYQVGMCHFNQIASVDRDESDAFKALKAFERLTARFPNSNFSFLAEKMVRECKRTLGEKEFYVGEFYFNIKQYQAALRRFEKVAKEYANVGLDYKISYYILETKRRLTEVEAKKKPPEAVVKAVGPPKRALSQ
jgi:outer membrane protein assembly factor BamD